MEKIKNKYTVIKKLKKNLLKSVALLLGFVFVHNLFSGLNIAIFTVVM